MAMQVPLVGEMPPTTDLDLAWVGCCAEGAIANG